MSEYEVVQEHEYQDIYRLRYGVLLIVNKYENIKSTTERGVEIPIWNWTDTSENKNKLKKLKGLKNLYQVKEDLHTRFNNNFIKKDTIIFDNTAIKPLSNKEEYYYELKTTSSCFSGDLNGFKELVAMVNEILEKY